MEVDTLNLTLGNAERKFLYRKGPADEVTIVQALKNTAYNFGRLRRAKELSDLYDRLVQTGKAPLIIDAGANIGASTVYFAFAFPKARLVTIEPERSNFELLTANMTDLPVECLHAVVAPAAGVSKVVDPGNGFPAGQTAGSNDGAKAMRPAADVSINEIYERNTQITLPFIVKIDIERCEGELFSANTEWVDRTPIIIVQLNDCLIPGTKNSHAFVEHLAGRNRDLVYLHDCIFSIDRDLKPN
jgi:FkbM family methyltransferase